MLSRCPLCGEEAQAIQLTEKMDDRTSILTDYAGCSNPDCPLHYDEIIVPVDRWQTRPIELELREENVELLFAINEAHKRTNMLQGAIDQLEANLDTAWTLYNDEHAVRVHLEYLLTGNIQD